MSVELTGSYTHHTAGSDGSFSVNVPADADICIVHISGYYNVSQLVDELNWDNGAALDFTKITNNGFGAAVVTEAWYMTSNDGGWPGSGSKTLYFGLPAGSFLEGYHLVVSFWKNVDVIDPIVDFEVGADAGDRTSPQTSSLESIGADDMCIAQLYDYNNTPDLEPSGYGQAELFASSIYNNCCIGIGYKLGESAFRIEGMSYGAPVYFALRADSSILPINLNSLVQSHSIGNMTLAQKNTLSTDNLAHAMTIGTPTLLTVSSLIVQGLNQAQSVTAVTLTQKHILALANLAHNQGITVVDLIQQHNLTVAGLTQAQSMGGVTIELAGLLSVASLLHTQGIDNLDITQAHNLAVNNLSQSQDIGSVDLAMALLLEVAGLTQSHSLDALEISLVDVLAVDSLGHVHNLGSMDLSQAHELLVNDLQHSQNITEVSFVTIKGRVTITMSMKVPSMSFEIKTPNITFEME